MTTKIAYTIDDRCDDAFVSDVRRFFDELDHESIKTVSIMYYGDGWTETLRGEQAVLARFGESYHGCFTSYAWRPGEPFEPDWMRSLVEGESRYFLSDDHLAALAYDHPETLWDDPGGHPIMATVSEDGDRLCTSLDWRWHGDHGRWHQCGRPGNKVLDGQDAKGRYRAKACNLHIFGIEHNGKKVRYEL